MSVYKVRERESQEASDMTVTASHHFSVEGRMSASASMLWRDRLRHWFIFLYEVVLFVHRKCVVDDGITGELKALCYKKIKSSNIREKFLTK